MRSYEELQKRIKQFEEQNEVYKRSLIEVVSLFNFDRSARLPVEIGKLDICREFFVYEAKGLGVVRGEELGANYPYQILTIH